MKAILYGDVQVEIDPDSVGGGSFRIWKPDLARAYNDGLIAFFHKKLLSVPIPYFVDIGANTGGFTLLGVHTPNCKVVALEPNPNILPLLRSNCTLNNFPAITLPHAAWNESTALDFYALAGDHGLSRVREAFRHGGTWAKEKVQAKPLDVILGTYGIGKCDFLKIDVEGAELMVLQGAENVIKLHRPAIFLEWWPPHCAVFGYDPIEIDHLLVSWGYEVGEPVGHYRYYERSTRYEV